MNAQSKTRYFLIEIIICCFVFAIAAAICLNLFVVGYLENRDSRALSMATMEAQNVAEIVKASKGDSAIIERLLEAGGVDGTFTLGFDEDWQRVTPEESMYTLVAKTYSEGLYFVADITVADDATIFELKATRYLGGDEEVSG